LHRATPDQRANRHPRLVEPSHRFDLAAPPAQPFLRSLAVAALFERAGFSATYPAQNAKPLPQSGRSTLSPVQPVFKTNPIADNRSQLASCSRIYFFRARVSESYVARPLFSDSPRSARIREQRAG